MRPSLLQTRRARQGGLSLAVTIAFVAVIIALNLTADALTRRYDLKADLTGSGVFTISAQTIAFLAGLEDDIEIYVLNSEQNFTAHGSYYVQAAEIIKQFDRASDRVSVTFLDLMRNPGFTARYPDLGLHSDYVLVVRGSRVRLLSTEELFNLQTDDWGNYYITSSRADHAVVSAIAGLTSNHVTQAGVLTGHGESPAHGLCELLELNNYVMYTINPAAQNLTPELDLLILSAPQADYAPEELTRLSDWLYNSGNYGKTLFYLAAVDQPALPNLDAFLADWGVAVEPGIVFETDYYYLAGNGWFLTMADYAERAYSWSVRDSGLLIYMPNARPLADISRPGSGLRTTVLLDYTQSAGVRSMNSPLVDWTPTYEEVRGPIPALLLSQQGWESATPSNLLVAATSLAVEEGILENPTYANSTYYLSLLSTLTGRDDAILIEPKRLGSGYMNISYGQQLIWGAMFFILLPVAILAAGGVMYLHRRHL